MLVLECRFCATRQYWLPRPACGTILAATSVPIDLFLKDMVHNHYAPRMEVDAQTYAVRADGQLLTCEPATILPMAQRYFLF